MTDKGKIEKIVKDFTGGTELFLVSVKISGSNKITVFADTMAGIKIDECAALHRHIEKNLDREAEDFELQVSSPGLDLPFIVIEQYYKNQGKKVEVISNEGLREYGILKNVTPGGFELETQVKVKGKPKETREVSFNFDQVKSTRIILSI